MDLNLCLSGLPDEHLVVAESLNRSLAAGKWEQAISDFAEFYSSQDLLTWLVNFPLDDPESEACVKNMRRWLQHPDEDLRWKIFEQAQTLGFSHRVGATGLSLFWSQGSMTAEGLEPVYPEPHLFGQMLLCALKLVCVRLSEDGTLPQGTYRLFSHWFEQKKNNKE